MGFLDGAGNLLNRGVANAGRSTRSLSIKATLTDLKKQREELCCQLGASLYEETRQMASLHDPRQALYAAIEALDVQRATLQNELADIEEQARLARAAGSRRCPSCGTPFGPEDMVCVECGTRVESPSSVLLLGRSDLSCAVCGEPLAGDVRFCMNCGATVHMPTTAPSASDAFAPMPTPVPDGSQTMPAPVPPTPADAPSIPSTPAPMPIGQRAALCSNGGYENGSDAVFCRSCGQRL